MSQLIPAHKKRRNSAFHGEDMLIKLLHEERDSDLTILASWELPVVRASLWSSLRASMQRPLFPLLSMMRRSPDMFSWNSGSLPSDSSVARMFWMVNLGGIWSASTGQTLLLSSRFPSFNLVSFRRPLTLLKTLSSWDLLYFTREKMQKSDESKDKSMVHSNSCGDGVCSSYKLWKQIIFLIFISLIFTWCL